MDDLLMMMLVNEFEEKKKREEFLKQMRNPTEEEQDAINEYIHSIAIDTGINIFDLMEELENE